ncbi:MAG: murein biosynthesis integral membrane protein MurJ, partial [Desulfamplus sp.]|nr:murein biosynthesis integral membrane protein MurJ [Desulfamplus sp.]
MQGDTSGPAPSFHKNMIKGAGIISVAALASRILGFIRDAALAGTLGAGLYSDAFFAAFRIPDLFRRFFADGALSISFIPVFTKEMLKRGKEEAFKMARSILVWLSLISLLLFFILYGENIFSFLWTLFKYLHDLILYLLDFFLCEGRGGGIPSWGGGIASWDGGIPSWGGGIPPWGGGIPSWGGGILSWWERNSWSLAGPGLTLELLLIMMPYVVFIAFMAVFMGILHSLGHFAAPATAPVLFNMVMILAALGAAALPSAQTAHAMAWAVTAGGGLQLLLLIPFIHKKGFSIKGEVEMCHAGVKRFFKMTGPAVAGMGSCQVNLLICTLLGSFLAQGSISHLYYADRLIQFPLALFAVSLSTSLFPELSKKIASSDIDEASFIFTRGLSMVLFISIPSMAGLIILRDPITALLFHQGAFGPGDVQATGHVLLFLSTGLWALS